MSFANLTDIAATTIKNYEREFADNVTENNALIKFLRKRGNVKLLNGGESIIEPLIFAENGTFKYYSGYEVLDVSPSDVISAAEYAWRQAGIAITMSGLEMRKNSGMEAFLNLLEGRIQAAEATMMNQLAVGAYSDGTGSGGKQIGGLQLLIDDSPATGTVGGINAANWGFWRNQKVTATNTSAGTITSQMNTLFRRCSRGADKPDVIFADDNFFGYYESSLQDIQRITNPRQADAGFNELMYKGTPVIFDGGYGGACPANHLYMVNTKYLRLKIHRDANFSVTEDVRPVNQDAFARLILFMGNLTCNNRFLQGVLSA